MYVMQIVKHWAVGVLLLLNSVATFLKTWTSGIDVLSSHQESNVLTCEEVRAIS